MRDAYGMIDGKPIQPPKGWVMLSEGAPIPQVHCEYDGQAKMWCRPRRCHSTMTAFTACIWGYVQAVAIPETEELKLRITQYGCDWKPKEKEEIIIKQIDAIIDSETEDIFYIRGEMMVKCVLPVKSLEHIAAVLKDNVKRKQKPVETEDQRRTRMMKHFRDK